MRRARSLPAPCRGYHSMPQSWQTRFFPGRKKSRGRNTGAKMHEQHANEARDAPAYVETVFSLPHRGQACLDRWIPPLEPGPTTRLDAGGATTGVWLRTCETSSRSHARKRRPVSWSRIVVFRTTRPCFAHSTRTVMSTGPYSFPSAPTIEYTAEYLLLRDCPGGCRPAPIGNNVCIRQSTERVLRSRCAAKTSAGLSG